jgi:hypothetical protein
MIKRWIGSEHLKPQGFACHQQEISRHVIRTGNRNSAAYADQSNYWVSKVKHSVELSRGCLLSEFDIMKSIICSGCLKKFSLRMLAENTGVISDEACPRCKSSKWRKLSEADFVRLMESYFENGSIDLSVGNHQPKYRLRKTEETHYENLALDNELIQDCRMLHELTGYSIDLNYSRLTNMGIWGRYADIQKITSQDQSEETFDELDELLTNILSKFKTDIIPQRTNIFRIKRNLKHDIDVDTAIFFDPKDPKADSQPSFSRDRFSASIIPVFYGAFDIATCLFECRPEYLEELTLGTFEVSKELRLLDLENIQEAISGYEAEDLGYFVSRMLYQREYALNSYISIMAFRLGFDGLKYCSYFSKVRKNRFMNVAIFGTPIEKGILTPVSFDRVTIDNVQVEYSLGPVFQKQKEKQLIMRITSQHQQRMESELPREVLERMPKIEWKDDFKINIHSLATIKRIFEK